jgi:hypothetical protein
MLPAAGDGIEFFPGWFATWGQWMLFGDSRRYQVMKIGTVND